MDACASRQAFLTAPMSCILPPQTGSSAVDRCIEAPVKDEYGSYKEWKCILRDQLGFLCPAKDGWAPALCQVRKRRYRVISDCPVRASTPTQHVCCPP